MSSSAYEYTTYSLAGIIVLTILRRLHQSKCLVRGNGDVEVTLDTSQPQTTAVSGSLRGFLSSLSFLNEQKRASYDGSLDHHTVFEKELESQKKDQEQCSV